MSVPDITAENYEGIIRKLSKPIDVRDRLEILVNIGLYELTINKKQIALDNLKIALAVAKLYGFNKKIIEKIQEIISKLIIKQSE